MSILIVDDCRDNRRLLKCILQAAGYKNVLTAGTASGAIEKLSGGNGNPHIDLILMDYRMPDIDGIQACKLIKRDARLKDIPIIMVTANTDNEILEAAFQAGAVDYISKPLNEVELLARIRSALLLKEEIECRKIRERELIKTTSLLAEANKALEKLTKLDPLTGIANRRCFNEYFKREWKRAQRNSSYLSLILIDIDHFKRYNDTYGHQQGDECLKRIAQTLSESLKRPADLVARYGGEEFVVVLPGVDATGLIRLAESLRQTIINLQIPHSNSFVSISLGAATFIPDSSSSASILLNEADQALYHAKRSGRNRAVLWDTLIRTS